jgi:hypothetical protein
MKLPYIDDIKWEWNMRHDPDCTRALMYRYWHTLLIVCGVVLVTSLLFVVWTVFVPLGTLAITADVAVKGRVETVSRERVRATLDSFEQRALYFEQVSNNPPSVEDPSR